MGRGSDDGSASAFSLASRAAAARRARGGGSAAAAVNEEALLALRDECQQAKLRERAAEDKMRQLAAQLMRTEEAAKRILTRTDPSARGGCAQRLLDAEREVGRLKAELAEAEAQLAVAKRQAADYKRQGGEAKKRLEAALADQRRLALQLGRSGGGFGASAGRSLAALSTNTLSLAAAGGSPASGAKAPRPGATGAAADEGTQARGSAGDAEAEAAAAARRFAEQQEQLVAARERGSTLEQQLRERDALVEQQAGELSSLRAQLASNSRASCAKVASSAAGVAALQGTASAAVPVGLQQLGRTSSEGSEGGGEAWLRLKYLKAKSALDSVVASNTRLLRELEAAQSHLRSLQAQQAQQAPQWGQQQSSCEACAGPAQLAGSRTDERGAATASSFGGSSMPGASGSAAAAALRQQLAAANHRADCLQIELEAALAKLTIYQAHSLWRPQPGLQPSQQPTQQATEQQPSRQPSRHATERQEAAVQRAVKAERVASWLRGEVPAGPSLGSEAAGRELPVVASTAGTMQQEAPPQAQQIVAEECMHGTGLAPHQNLVELHLFAAELAPDAPLGPLGLTCCTVDFWTCDTKIGTLAEGRRPLYNTTLQFVVGMTAGLMEHLASGCARVQLHACRSGVGGSPADYETIASANIPLACLVAGEERPAAYQQATLLRPDGTACGTLQYALASIKPMRCHPAAGPLLSPSQAAAATPAKMQNQQQQAGQVQVLPRLLVDLVGCKDLRCSDKAAGELQPYVALMLPQPSGRAPLLFESRPSAGGSPVFSQQAAFSVTDQTAASQQLEAVVFDAAAGTDAQQSIIGVARIALPPAGSSAAVGATQLHPLLHPISGRHAGALEVGVRWG